MSNVAKVTANAVYAMDVQSPDQALVAGSGKGNAKRKRRPKRDDKARSLSHLALSARSRTARAGREPRVAFSGLRCMTGEAGAA